MYTITKLDDGKTWYVDYSGYGIFGERTYTVTVGSLSVTFTAPLFTTPTVSWVSTNGFMLELSEWIEDLEKDDLELWTVDGVQIGIRDLIQRHGAQYYVQADLDRSEQYTFTIHKDGYKFLDIPDVLPAARQFVHVTVEKPNVNGFVLRMSPAAPGLDKDIHLPLLTNEAQPQSVPIASLTEEEDGAVYKAAASLTVERSYRLRPDHPDYIFYSTSYWEDIFFPNQIVFQTSYIPVTTDIVNPATTGFQLVFDTPVPNLRTDEIKVCETLTLSNCRTIQSLATEDGMVYDVAVPLEQFTSYKVTIERDGYTFVYEQPSFMIQVVSVGVEVTETSKYGIGFALDQPVELDQTHIRIFKNTNNNLGAEVAVASVSTDDRQTYRVEVAGETNLVPDEWYYLVITKPGFVFGNYHGVAHGYGYAKSFLILQKVRVTIPGDSIDGTGFTIHLNPGVPGLEAGRVGIAYADGSTVYETKTLTPMDQSGEIYRVNITLKGGKSYKIAWTPPNGYELEDVQFTVPVLQATAQAEVKVDTGLYDIYVYFNIKVPDLEEENFLVWNDFDFVKMVSVIELYGGEGYRVRVEKLRDGAEHFVLPVADGYDFGEAAGFTAPVIVMPDVTAWTDGIALRLKQAVPELAMEHITLKQGGVDVNLSGAAIKTLDGGAYHEIRLPVPLTVGQRYDLNIDVPGYYFWPVSPTATTMQSLVNVTEFSRDGMTLAFRTRPTIGELTVENVVVYQAGDPGDTIRIRSVTSDDDWATAVVVFDEPVQYDTKYNVNIIKSGYEFLEGDFTLYRTRADLREIVLTDDGVAFRVVPAIDDLAKEEVIIADLADREIPVTELRKLDDYGKYEAVARLYPGTHLRLMVERDEFRFDAFAYVETPAPEIRVEGISPDGVTVRIAPAVPHLVREDFRISLAGEEIPIQEAASEDEGHTWRITLAEPFAEFGNYGLLIDKTYYYFGPPVSFTVPIARFAGAEPVPDGVIFELHHRRAIPDLLKEEVVIRDSNGLRKNVALLQQLDTYGYQWRAEVEGGLAGGETHALSIERGDVLSIPTVFTAIQGVYPAVSGITGSGFRLLLAPAVDGLAEGELTLTRADTMADVPIAYGTADGGNTYDVTVVGGELEPGTEYVLELNREHTVFHREVRFTLAMPPFPTEALVDTDGATIRVRFSKDIDLDAGTNFAVAVVEGENTVPVGIEAVEYGADHKEILLELASPIRKDDLVVLSRGEGDDPAAVAEDGGRLFRLADTDDGAMSVPNLTRPLDYAEYLANQGESTADIARKLRDDLDLELAEIAMALAVPVGEIRLADALLQLEPELDPAGLAAAFRSAGWNADAAAYVLRTKFAPEPADLALWLKDAGFELYEVMYALSTDRSLTMEQVALALLAAALDAGAAPEYRAKVGAIVARDFYGNHQAAAARVLRAHGIPAGIALAAIVEVYGIEPSAAIEAMAAAKYPAADLGQLLGSVAGMNEVRAVRLMMDHGYGFGDILAMLDVYAGETLAEAVLAWLRQARAGVWLLEQAVPHFFPGGGNAGSAYDALRAAGYDETDALSLLVEAYNNVFVAAQTGKAKSASPTAVVEALRRFGETAESALRLMRNANFAIEDIRDPIMVQFGLGADEVDSLIGTNFPADQVMAAMRYKDANAAVAYLLTKPGYSQYPSEMVKALRQAGFSPEEIARAVKTLDSGQGAGMPAQVMANVLRNGGMDAADAVAGMFAAYSAGQAADVIRALSYEYGAVDTVRALDSDVSKVLAWIRTDVLRNGKYPWYAVDVGNVLGLFELDAGEAAKALREAGFDLVFAARLLEMEDFYAVSNLADLIDVLRQAGYTPYEVLLYTAREKNALNYLNTLTAAGYSVLDIGTAMKETGYTPSQTVGGLKPYFDAGQAALEAALVLRDVYGIGESDAVDALSGHYEQQVALNAVIEAYGIEDFEMFVLEEFIRKGYDPEEVAGTLRKRYGVTDPLEAAQRLDQLYADHENWMDRYPFVIRGIAAWYVDLFTPEGYQTIRDVMTQLNADVEDWLLILLRNTFPAGNEIWAKRLHYMGLPFSYVITMTHDQFGSGLDYDRAAHFDYLLNLHLYGVTAEEKFTAFIEYHRMSPEEHDEFLGDWLGYRKEQGAVANVHVAFSNVMLYGGLVYPDSMAQRAFRILAPLYGRNNALNVIAGWFDPAYPYTIEMRLLKEVHQYSDAELIHYLVETKGTKGTALDYMKAAMDYKWNQLDGGAFDSVRFMQLLLAELGEVSGDATFEMLQFLFRDKDEALIPKFKTDLKLGAYEARMLLQYWRVSAYDAMGMLDRAGYTPEEIFGAAHQVGGGPDVREAVKFFKNEKQMAPRQIAYYIALHDIQHGTAGRIANYLRNAGFSYHDVVFALAPAQIAFDADQAPEGQYAGAPSKEFACIIQSIRQPGESAALAIVHAKANLGQPNEQKPLNLIQVIVLSGFRVTTVPTHIWNTVHELAEDAKGRIVVGRALDNFDLDEDETDALAIRLAREIGLDEYDAAYLLKKVGRSYLNAYRLMIKADYNLWMTHRAIVSYYMLDIMMDIAEAMFGQLNDRRGSKAEKLGLTGFKNYFTLKSELGLVGVDLGWVKEMLEE